MMFAFTGVNNALDAAVLIQQSVARRNRAATQRFEVRIGIAMGEVTTERDDYFGEPVVEAARLCALAEGGQVLVTDLVRLMTSSTTQHGFESVGELTLKGLPTPVSRPSGRVVVGRRCRHAASDASARSARRALRGQAPGATGAGRRLAACRVRRGIPRATGRRARHRQDAAGHPARLRRACHWRHGAVRRRPRRAQRPLPAMDRVDRSLRGPGRRSPAATVRRELRSRPGTAHPGAGSSGRGPAPGHPFGRRDRALCTARGYGPAVARSFRGESRASGSRGSPLGRPADPAAPHPPPPVPGRVAGAVRGHLPELGPEP